MANSHSLARLAVPRVYRRGTPSCMFIHELLTWSYAALCSRARLWLPSGPHPARRSEHGRRMMGDMDTAGAVTGGHAGYSGACPFTVDKRVMRQRWERLTFLHWSDDPDVVQRLLPGGLTVDTFGGAAWVGLVPFFMRVHTPGDRGAPWVSDFCETNVRTYAVDREGRASIWSCRSMPRASARWGWAGPATSSRTTRPPCGSAGGSLRSPTGDQEIAYSCQRRLPGPRTATSQVRVHIGTPYQPAELGDRGHFLTARWVLFSVLAGRQFFARAEHQPWPLYRGEALTADDSLMTAAGLPAPRGEPLVHYSPGSTSVSGGRRGTAGPRRSARGDLPAEARRVAVQGELHPVRVKRPQAATCAACGIGVS